MVDIAHSNVEPSHFNKGKVEEVEKIHYGKKVQRGNRIVFCVKDENFVYEDLYKTKKSYPRKKQKERKQWYFYYVLVISISKSFFWL